MAHRGPYTGLTVKYPETYSSWQNAKGRCRNPKVNKYEYYGGRGITFSKKWDRFEDFLRDMGPRPPGTSIDRIDNNRGYEPGNCRWATPQEQRANQRKRTPAPNAREKPRSLAVVQAWFYRSDLTIEQFADRLGYSLSHTKYLLRGGYLWMAPQQALRLEAISDGALNAHQLVKLDDQGRRFRNATVVAFLERGVCKRTRAREPRRSGEAVSA